MKLVIHVRVEDPEGIDDNSLHVVEVPPAQARLMRVVFDVWRRTGSGLAVMVYSGLCAKVLRVHDGACHVAEHGYPPAQALRKRKRP
jgi:hypothetical protein